MTDYRGPARGHPGSHEERSPEALAFLHAVNRLAQDHGYAIEHEDSHGAFMVRRCHFNDTESRQWFLDAYEVVEDS